MNQEVKCLTGMNSGFSEKQGCVEIDHNNNNNEVVDRNSDNETTTSLTVLSKMKLLELKEANKFRVEEHLDLSEFTSEWSIQSSVFSKRTCNPVRKLIEQMKLEPNPELQMIALSIGDPTIMSEIGKPDTVINAVLNCIQDKRCDGYTPSYGSETARQSVASYLSRPDQLIYKTTDIYLTSGCSHALDLCITVLSNPGQNILLPRPGFSICKTLSATLGINAKYYNLLHEQDWEVDLVNLESQIDEKTVAIVVNNPSNPCGSVYSRDHLLDILRIAERHKIPIIADEVYGEMVFAGREYYYMSELSDTVPILSCNGLSKRFILPGWRVGWIAIHDPKNYLKDVRAGLNDLTTRILGPNSLVQAALPEILATTPQSYFDNVMKIIQENADIAYSKLSKLPGLRPIKSSGAMYMMVGIDLKHFPDIKTDLEFVQLLVREQSVFCLPAQVFECPNYIRIVVTMTKEKILEACERIGRFVFNHYV